MRRALTAAVTAVTLAVWSGAASAQQRVHVRDVRVGAHPGFDRVVVELDGPTDIAWERGPDLGQESFYLDADLGRRERVLRTKLEQVGTLTLSAMRVGTHVSLEPRERRVRAYLLAKPTRLVIDLAPAGPEDFAAPSGVTPLAPAKSVGSLKTAPIPAPEPTPEAEPETAPESAEAPPQGEAQPAPEPAPQASGEPVEGAVESAPEPAPEATPEPEPQTPEAPVAAAEPEVTAPEPAPAAETPAEPAPEPLPPETGFPWLLALGALVAAASVGGLGLWLWRHSAEPQPVTRSTAGRPTPLGVEEISSDELRFAADATVVLEQRLDQEVRARVALEERLGEASEELKVLRDRLSRIERRREEAR